MNGAPLRRIANDPMLTSTPNPNPTSDPKSSATSHSASNPLPNPPQYRLPLTTSDPWRADRLRDIFPPGLGSKSTGRKLPYTFAPHHLYDILCYHRGSRPAEQTVVYSAWYGKQLKSAKHEFIVIHVEDRGTPGLTNCIVIDRNQADASNTTMLSSSGAASDTFRVSYDGDQTQLLRQSHLSPYKVLEEMKFQAGRTLLFQQVVALVYHISEKHPRYNPVDTNCYWFTGLIWECMRNMCPEASYSVLLPGKRGRISYARCVPKPHQVRNILQAIRQESDMFGPELSDTNYSATTSVEDTTTLSNSTAAEIDGTELKKRQNLNHW